MSHPLQLGELPLGGFNVKFYLHYEHPLTKNSARGQRKQELYLIEKIEINERFSYSQRVHFLIKRRHICFPNQIRLFTVFCIFSLAWATLSFAVETLAPVAPKPLNNQSKIFKNTFERDYPVNSSGEFRFTNLRGPLRIEGWSQNKIHVKVERKVQADSEESAAIIFRALDLRFQAMGHDTELAAEYGKGLKIQERLKEREEPKTEMALTIYAPARRKLRAWVGDSEVEIHGWESSIDVRSNQGPIRAEKISAGFVKLSCPTCSMTVKNVRANFRGISGGGNVDISHLTGDKIYVETTSGEQTIENVKGGQLYVSRTGKLQAKNLSGRIEFHTRKGGVNFENCSGFISGDTESGSMNVHYHSLDFWKSAEHSFFETDSGNISVNLPSGFQGIIEAASQKGKVYFGFPLQPLSNSKSLESKVDRAPISLHRITGRVGRSDRFLQISSREGEISVLRHD